MTSTATELAGPPPTRETGQAGDELIAKLDRLEGENHRLHLETKALRLLLERVIDHRQKSHGELVLLLTSLVSKLPMSDTGVILSKLVEHHTNVSQFLSALAKGTADDLPPPAMLRTTEQTKRDLLALVKPLVDELVRLDPPLESASLARLPEDPEFFFSPLMVRASRCFLKSQIPRERIVREFGEPALVFFADMTTDPKLNPHPKPAEIVLSFRPDFETLLQQNPDLLKEKRADLVALFQKVQRTKSAAEGGAQKRVFLKLSFVLELLYYYQHESTEPADVVFAQRLPAIIEQLALGWGQDELREDAIVEAEALLGHIANNDQKHMVINNVGKSGAAGKTLKFVLKLRAEKVSELDQVVPDFVKHLVSPGTPKTLAKPIAGTLRLINPDMQKLVLKNLLRGERIRREDAEALARAVAEDLGLKGILEEARKQESLSPELERKIAWANIADLIARRTDPAAVAAAIRDRLHAKYDADEIRQSWITLTETDPMSLIRICSHIPYLPDGRTDPIARTVLEVYVSRLTHEKYAGCYHKVINSLRNVFKAKPDSPTLITFMALVKWASPDAATRMCMDIGMPVGAH